MKVLSHLLVVPTLAAVLALACAPTNAARRVGGSPYDGTPYPFSECSASVETVSTLQISTPPFTSNNAAPVTPHGHALQSVACAP